MLGPTPGLVFMGEFDRVRTDRHCASNHFEDAATPDLADAGARERP
jgi:hypothetical protein